MWDMSTSTAQDQAAWVWVHSTPGLVPPDLLEGAEALY